MIPKLLNPLGAWIAMSLWSLLCAGLDAQSIDRTSKVADGELKDCHLISVDQAWAVGDRGLILATKDAGKTWACQSERSDATLNAVCFANEMTGWALGGTIDPHSHRSVGVVMHTINGGQSWQTLASRLPRILGVQCLGRDHLLAWGDWSNVYQSSLFESIDSGLNWTARPVPSGHLQSACLGTDGCLVVVDRMGNVYRSIDGTTYHPVDISSSPFEPIRFCKNVAEHWWLGGDAGQLYKSKDAEHWDRLLLPGSKKDHDLISLRDLSGFGNRISIVGVPGQVVWTSDNLGQSWSVASLAGSTVTHSISYLNRDVLMTCGALANIQLSRNGGKAWWAQHQSGSRYAILNVASNADAVAWDLLTHAAIESRRHVAVQVVHDKEFQDRASYQPELASRVETAAKSVQISECSTLSCFPIGNLPSGVRQSDLIHYRVNRTRDAETVSTIVRKLVWTLRTHRPDVVVFQADDWGNPADHELSAALELAQSLASQKDYSLFSSASGISNTTWNTKRTMIRTRMSGLSYAQTMLLKSTNQFLAVAMSKIQPLVANTQSANRAKVSYRVLNQRSPIVRDPLEGIAQDDSTLMCERISSQGRLATTMSVGQLLDWQSILRNERVNPFIPDRSWESKLKSLSKDVAPSTLAPILFQIAVENRRIGEWSRWQSCLELLIELDQESSWTESAYWELMAHTGSEEVRRLISTQMRQLGERVEQEQITADTLQQSSPFANATRDAFKVQQVTYAAPVRRLRIASHRDLNEFTRILSRWPNSMQTRRNEPSWAWLIAARYRLLQLKPELAEGIDTNRSVSVFWPTIPDQVSGWHTVANAEREIAKTDPRRTDSYKGSITDLSSIHKIGRTTERPYLDGIADEAFWANALVLQLRDPWSKDSAITTMRLARDGQFIYVHSSAPKYKTDSNHSFNQNTNRRDSLQDSSDHLKIRFDIDRDYATWFEFGWSASEEKIDRCNDMPFWNPEWYAKTTLSETHWQSEIAIPIESLAGTCELSNSDVSEGIWAFNVIRSVPSIGSFSASPFISDQLRPDEWLHVDLRP